MSNFKQWFTGKWEQDTAEGPDTIEVGGEENASENKIDSHDDEWPDTLQ